MIWEGDSFVTLRSQSIRNAVIDGIYPDGLSPRSYAWWDYVNKRCSRNVAIDILKGDSISTLGYKFGDLTMSDASSRFYMYYLRKFMKIMNPLTRSGYNKAKIVAETYLHRYQYSFNELKFVDV